MTHIRIRASLGGNIPRISKILPIARDAFGFYYMHTSKSSHPIVRVPLRQISPRRAYRAASLPSQNAYARRRLIATDVRPRRPQAVQTNLGSRSDSRRSSATRCSHMTNIAPTDRVIAGSMHASGIVVDQIVNLVSCLGL